jgi:C4-dicarboxylate transporter DctQ subunit
MMKPGKALLKVEFSFLAACMLGTTFLLFANVALRYLFHSSIFWAEEVLRYLIVWVTFVGAATCVREKAHISLDTLTSALPPRPRFVMALVGGGICIGSSLLLLRYALTFVLKMRSSGQVSATIGNFPMYIVYSCIPLGFLLISVWSVKDLADVISRRRAEQAARPTKGDGGGSTGDGKRT